MNLSSIIINHEIRELGSFAGNDVHKMLLYYSREGEYREIGGCDRTITAADNELERFKELNTYEDLVNYSSRQGRYKNRNQELPLLEGQYSGACFDQQGLVDPEKLKEELMNSQSHLITSVVSVRREDALRLGLATKDDFQQLLRKEWQKQCEQWKVIEPQNIKWAAWFHTDNEKNLHVHVVTWDRSGHFSEPRQRIPHEQIWTSQSGLRREALKGSIAELNSERGFLRDYIVQRINFDFGRGFDRAKFKRLSAEAIRLNSSLDIQDKKIALSLEKQAEIINLVMSKMPEGTVKGYSYARSSEEVRHAALDAIAELKKSDPLLQAAFERYEEIVREVAEGIGLRNEIERVGDTFRNPANEYFKDATFDLNRRAANAVLKNCNNGVNLRDIHCIHELRNERQALLRSKDVDTGTLAKDSTILRAYADKCLNIARERAKRPLTELQEYRIRTEALNYITRTAERRIRYNTTLDKQRDYQAKQVDRFIRNATRDIRSKGQVFTNTIAPSTLNSYKEDYTNARNLYRLGKSAAALDLCSKMAERLIKDPAPAAHISTIVQKTIERNPQGIRNTSELRSNITAQYREKLEGELYQSIASSTQPLSLDVASLLSGLFANRNTKQERGSLQGMFKSRKPQEHEHNRHLKDHIR